MKYIRRHSSKSQAVLFSCKRPPEFYSCPHCYFENDLSIVLKVHSIGLHKNEKTEEVEDYYLSTYDCKTCKFRTFSVLVMLKHVVDGCKETTEPSIFQRKRFECAQCPFVTSYKDSLKKHKICKHTGPEDIEWLECDRCGLKFKSVYLLRRHVRQVHEIEWHQCAQCSYKTVFKDHLKSHVYRKHSHPSEIKWFKCDQCSHRTIYKNGLKVHLDRVHLNKRWFACDRCSYAAKCRSQLKSHMISKHTSAKRNQWHRCDQCPFKTKKKARFLRNHKLRMHGKV